VDSKFLHDTNNALKLSGDNSPNMGLIRNSSEILFEGNYVNGYFQGIQFNDSKNFEVIGNEFTNLQGDGFRGGGLQQGLIANNYMHDFFGSNQSVNHSDMIQLWGYAAKSANHDITITDNVLIGKGDSASQSIFMRNEEFSNTGHPASGYHTNITITNNLIYNGHLNGIRVDDVKGAVIEGNTLLYNKDAGQYDGSNYHSYSPSIYARNSPDITINDNIADWIHSTMGGNIYDNQIVNHTNPSAANYYGKHFIGATKGDAATLADLMLRPDSPWVGTGSSRAWPGGMDPNDPIGSGGWDYDLPQQPDVVVAPLRLRRRHRPRSLWWTTLATTKSTQSPSSCRISPSRKRRAASCRR
jgi:hypothetical protein